MKQISAEALRRSFIRWFIGGASVFTQGRMQTLGLVYAMEPIIRDLYEGEEEIMERLSSYRTFFNTEPQIGAAVIGMAAALEEDRANGSGMSDEMMRTVRNGLMGSLAGLGDTMLVGAVIPVLLCTALGMGTAGVIGYMLVYGVFGAWLQYRLFLRVYRKREEGLTFLYGRKTEAAVRACRHGALFCIAAAFGRYGILPTDLRGLVTACLLVLAGAYLLKKQKLTAGQLLISMCSAAMLYSLLQ